MSDAHTNRELRAFNAFAKAQGWDLDSCAIEKRKPKEPDLLVVTPSGETVGYEMVEIMGEDFGGMIGKVVGTKKALQKQLKALPPGTRQVFEGLYSDALLYFRFSEGSTVRARTDELPRIFDWLMTLPEDFVGDKLVDGKKSSCFISVNVSRGRFQRPVLDPASGGYIGDAANSSISKKLRKEYETTHPAELIAHLGDQPMLPDDVWQSNLRELLAKFGFGQFRAIWVLSENEKQVLFHASASCS